MDILPIIVNRAKKTTKQNIILGDILTSPLPKCDFCLCSGALNTFSRFETYLFIKRVLQISKKALIFNLLKGNRKSDIFNYFLPDEINAILNKKKYKTSIIQDYLGNDFTVKIEPIKKQLI